MRRASVWLGHTKLDTTARYLNVTAQYLHELNERKALTLVRSSGIGRTCSQLSGGRPFKAYSRGGSINPDVQHRAAVLPEFVGLDLRLRH
jgi:hypothetical protein